VFKKFGFSVAVGSVPVAVFGLFWWVTILSEPAADVQIAKDAILEVLKDPKSAQFSDITHRRGDRAVCGRVNAKNGFGGYTGPTRFIVLDGQPVVDDGGDDFGRQWASAC
jgi:hypothetical protein